MAIFSRIFYIQLRPAHVTYEKEYIEITICCLLSLFFERSCFLNLLPLKETSFFSEVNIFHLYYVLLAFLILIFSAFSDAAGSCELSSNWMGRWFHLGFNEPLVISSDEISRKGRCVQRSKNMFLMEERYVKKIFHSN